MLKKMFWMTFIDPNIEITVQIYIVYSYVHARHYCKYWKLKYWKIVF